MQEPVEGRALKIAIASSGLAHVKRGVESWAEDLGEGLRRAGADATTFQGSANANGKSGTVVPCWKRTDSRAERWVKMFQGRGGWRFGFGSTYDVEQTTFALNLFPRIARGFDILHVQDPIVALIFDSLNRARLSRPRVILGHGTEEPPSLLRRYSYLQHLAPNYLDDWMADKPASQLAFAVPNFVDTERFKPIGKAQARAAFGLPQDALILLSIGALKKSHKRMDYLLREFKQWQETCDGKLVMVIAGARETETDDVLRLAAELPAGSALLIENAPRSQVAELFRAADIFTLASLHEMMPIAVLEALASGLPVACNDDPTLRWIVGDAGQPTNIEQPGALAAQFRVLADPATRARMGVAARCRAEAAFSEKVVVEQMLTMYQEVSAAAR